MTEIIFYLNFIELIIYTCLVLLIGVIIGYAISYFTGFEHKRLNNIMIFFKEYIKVCEELADNLIIKITRRK